MTRHRISLVAVACLAAGRAAAQDTIPTQLRQVRALLADSQVAQAIHVAEQYTGAHPRDEHGFLALGDAWFQHMPMGRFQAARAYQEAERLAPRDPEAAYQYAQVGLWLGGDDGEAMAKRGLERALALDPLYHDAWDEWLTLFRNAGSRRHMADLLSPYRANPVIRSRLALLAIEAERYAEANQLLDSALVADPTNTAWLALRAQSAFEAGDTASGWAYYTRALAHADRDSTDALWRQVIGIARPYEVKLWEAGVPPDQKEGWLESFWARRNPDLFAGVNLRVAEHFARLRVARKNYPLLHPLISYHRSQIARAMNLEPSEGEREYYQRCEMYEVLVPPSLHAPLLGMRSPEAWGVSLPTVSDARDEARINLSPWSVLTQEERDRVTAMAHSLGQRSPIPSGLAQALFQPLNMNLTSMDSVAARIGYNLATGLDDRGIMYLRFGPPDRQYMGGKNAADPHCSVMDVERWDYAAYGEVRFARPSAFSKGERNVPDMVFRAMNERQFNTVKTGLTADASSEPAPLAFGIWTVQFADSAAVGLTDVVVVSTRGAVAASLEGAARAGDVWIGSSGVTTVRSEPGRYVLVAQAQDSGVLGRQTLALAVRAFDRVPALSELLLAPAWQDQSPDRAAMLAHLRRTLVFAPGSTIRIYLEVYGLQSADQTLRYQVQYLLLKTDAPERDIQLAEWPGAIALDFQRVRPTASTGVTIETLDIVPSQVPPGRYLLRVRVRDLVTGADAGRSTISFAVR